METPAAARLERLATQAAMGAFAVGALVALVVHARAPVLPYDDAYITFRYVDQLWAGNGWVFNAGERVFGSSTPGYVLLLSALRALCSDTAWLAVRLNAIGLILAAYAAAALVRASGGHRAVGWTAGALVLLSPPLLAVSLGGMESFWFVAAALGALVATARGSWRLAGLAFGVALLFRLEALALGPALLFAWRRRPREALWAAALGLGVAALWYAPAWIAYGTPVPHSLLAKLRPVYPQPPGTAALRLGGWWLDLLCGRYMELDAAWRGALGLGALGLAAAWAARAGATAAALGLVGVVAFYAAGNPLFFEWYWPSIAVLGLVVSALALGRLPGRLQAALLAVMSAAVLLPYTADPEALQEPIALSQLEADPSRLRTQAYRAVGQRIAAERPGARVLASEIGALGSTYSGPIVDACGLVSPEALPFLPVAGRLPGLYGAIALGLVQETQPDLIVTLSAFLSPELLASPWFREHYAIAWREPLARPCYGSKSVVVLDRR